jgi:hypothetical protein
MHASQSPVHRDHTQLEHAKVQSHALVPHLPLPERMISFDRPRSLTLSASSFLTLLRLVHPSRES